jgi:hypothetical protein
MPASRSAGRSGSSGERCGEVTASIFSLPSRPNDTTEPAGSTASCTSPRKSAVTAAGEPGNGRCTSFTPALMASASMARCESEPRPIEPKVNLAASVLSSASSSATLVAATPG